MCGTHQFAPVDGQIGGYNSAEHESLRAVGRSLFVRYGVPDGRRRLEGAVHAMGAEAISQLGPFGANWCRKFLEKLLPDCHV